MELIIKRIVAMGFNIINPQNCNMVETMNGGTINGTVVQNITISDLNLIKIKSELEVIKSHLGDENTELVNKIDNTIDCIDKKDHNGAISFLKSAKRELLNLGEGVLSGILSNILMTL